MQGLSLHRQSSFRAIMKIRPAANMLTIPEAMAQATEVSSLRELCAYINARRDIPVQPHQILFEPRGYDKRTGWNTYLITIKGEPVLYSDGKFRDTREKNDEPQSDFGDMEE